MTLAVTAALAVVVAACGTTVPQQTTIGAGTAAGVGPAVSGDGTGDGTGSGSDAGQASGAPSTAGPLDAGGNTRPASAGGAPSPVAGVTTAGVPEQAGTSSAPVRVSAAHAAPTTTRTTGTATGKAGASAKPTTRSSAASTATGGPANTGPINVGIVYNNNAQTASALGAQSSTTIDQETVTKALVTGMNASGGVDGRMINASYYGFNTDDTSYSTDATSACQQFTQDNHESVVLDEAFGAIGGFNTCIAQAGVLDIDAAEETDAASSSKSVLHENPTTMNVDRLYSAVLDDLVQSGYLTTSNQLGVIVEDCPENLAAWSDTLAPLIAKLGLKAAVKADVDCTAGFQNAGSDAAPINNDVLTFHTKGVDRVMFVSLQEAVITLLFATEASTQQYRPGYLLSSNTEIGSQLASLPADQRPQVNGVGYQPTGDVADPPPPSAVEKRCIALAQAGGVNPATISDDGTVYFECAPLLLLEAGMKATAASSDPQTLTNAINGLGSSFASPGVLDNSTTFGPSRHDGPNTAQVFGYVASCTCVEYSGKPIPAP